MRKRNIAYSVTGLSRHAEEVAFERLALAAQLVQHDVGVGVFVSAGRLLHQVILLKLPISPLAFPMHLFHLLHL
jgi:hypothetical protein